LLGARLAADGQSRFPDLAAVPPRFAAALIAYEDRRFYDHLGVDADGARIPKPQVKTDVFVSKRESRRRNRE
jgi:penicillin-binding protein 1C